MATVIQIKRSANITAPATTDLVDGELAYSQDQSGNGAGAILYIESLGSGGAEVIHKVGGKYYTDIVDGATNNNTASKLVKRDSAGSFAANVITANSFVGPIAGAATSANIASYANVLTTPRTITLSGDVSGSASFNGSQDITITTTVQNNTVALGTDTTGDYVSNVLAGTGIVVTNQGGETATPTVALGASGVTASTYGGASKVPVLTVDTYGRITSAANVSVAGVSTFAASGNTFTIGTADGGSFSASIQENSVRLGTDTTGAYVGNLVAGTGITISGLGNEGTTPTITNAGVTGLSSGGYGITVSAATGSVSVTNTGVTRAIAGTGISLDTNNGNVTFTNSGVTGLTGTSNEVEVSASTGSITIGLPDNVTIGNNLTVTGNLVVNGVVTTLDTARVTVEDPLVKFGNANPADSLDIGFFGTYNNGGVKYAGLFRDASDSGKFKLFKDLQGDPDSAPDLVNTSGTGYTVATLVANLTGGTVSGLTSAIAVGDGGTGVTSFTSNGVLYGQGSSALAVATGSAGQVLQLNGSGVPVFGVLDGGTY
jgi:hypothetical protein